MSRSASRSRGPVWYQPMMRSRAACVCGGGGRAGEQAGGERQAERGVSTARGRGTHACTQQGGWAGGRANRKQRVGCSRARGGLGERPPPACRLPRRPGRTVDLFEHAEHVLQVGVVQEPDGRVLVVLLKRHCARGGRWGREERQVGAACGASQGTRAARSRTRAVIHPSAPRTPAERSAEAAAAAARKRLPAHHSPPARAPANALVASTRPLYVSPSTTPTTRLRVSLATRL